MKIDHIVVGSSKLEIGTKYVEKILNQKLSDVGYHDTMGTHNRVIKFANDCYLEVISINPSAISSNFDRWFGLDNERINNKISYVPQVIAFVIESNKNNNLYLEPINMKRGKYSWKFYRPNPLLEKEYPGIISSGILPNKISWVSKNPIYEMPKCNFDLYQIEINLLNSQKHYFELLKELTINKNIKFNFFNSKINLNNADFPNLKIKLIDRTTNKIINL